ncbi:MAG TPA: rubrerythrin family protein [Thermotogota bacterium]|nr:rubrerythrin family protein [Thermotogota bacterium]HRW93395.1 rubrerythrin family protein [Thermotogota bacterium]
MREMTKKFLLDAFAGESQAHMKYTIFAEEAQKKGMPNLANLFSAIAHAEFVHAKNHFKALKMVGSMEENLDAGIEGEDFEVNEMYPVYKNAAEFQDEKEAVRSAHYALEAEKIHSGMYQSAKEMVQQGKDFPASEVYICPVCGHTVLNGAPDKCPICGVPSDKFVGFRAK